MKKFLIIGAVVAAAAYGVWAATDLRRSEAPEEESGQAVKQDGMPVPGDDDAETDVEVDAELDSLGGELDAADAGTDSELDSLEVQAQ